MNLTAILYKDTLLSLAAAVTWDQYNQELSAYLCGSLRVGVNEGGPTTAPKETHLLALSSLFCAMIMKRVTLCLGEDSLSSPQREAHR